MKTRMVFLGTLVILLSIIPFGAYAQEKYVPKENEELYGTWTNQSANSAQPQKTVNFDGGYKDYEKISDTINPYEEGTEQIVEKWTDSEGNIWYKTLTTVTFGITPSGPYKGYDYKGWKFQSLEKLSKSGSVREVMSVRVSDFSPKLYPRKIDPDGDYMRFYRAEN
jgi:hypothetical protein